MLVPHQEDFCSSCNEDTDGILPLKAFLKDKKDRVRRIKCVCEDSHGAGGRDKQVRETSWILLNADHRVPLQGSKGELC